MSENIAFGIDASKAERGVKQFEKAITRIEAAVKRLDTSASNALAKIKTPNTDGFRKAAKDLQALSNIRLNPSLANNLQNISSSLSTFKAPNVRQIASTKELLKALGNANVSRSVGTSLQSLSSGLSGFRAPSKGQVLATKQLLNALGSAKISPTTARGLSQVKGALEGFRGISGTQAKNVSALVHALSNAKISGTVGRGIAAIGQGFHGFKAPTPRQIDNLERFVKVVGALRVPSNGHALAAYLSNISRASAGLGNSIGATNGLMRSTPYGKAANGAKVLTSNFRGLENAFSLSYQAGSQLRMLLGTLTAGEFIRQIYGAGMGMLRFKTTMDVATKSTAATAQELEYVRNVTERFGTSLDVALEDYSKFAVAMKLVGKTTDQTRAVFEATSAAVRTLGLSSDDQRGIFRALQQGFSKGKVTAEELRLQIGDRIPAAVGTMQKVWERFAKSKALNISFDKALEQGMIGSNAYIVLMQELAKEVESSLGKASVRADAELGRLSNAWLEFKAAVSDGGFMEAIANGARTLTKAFEDLKNNGMATKLGEGFAKFVEIVSKGFTFLVENMDTVIRALRGFIAFKLVGMTLNLASKGAMNLGNSLSGLSGAIKGGVGSAKNLAGIMGNLVTNGFQLAALALVYYWDEQYRLGDSTVTVGETFKATMGLIGDSVADGMKEAGTWLDYLSGKMDNTMNIRPKTKAFLDDMQSFLDVVLKSFASFSVTLGNEVAGIWNVISNTTHAAVTSGFSDAWKEFNKTGKVALEKLKADNNKIWSSTPTANIAKALTNQVEKTSKVVEKRILKNKEDAAKRHIKLEMEAKKRREQMQTGLKDQINTDNLDLLADSTKSNNGSLGSTKKALTDAQQASQSYVREVENLNKQLAAGKITQDQYNQSLNFSKKKLQEVTDPYAALLYSMQEEKDLLGLTGTARRIESDYRSKTNDLLAKGIALTDQQKASLRGLITEMDRLHNPVGIDAFISGLDDIQTAMGKIEEQAIKGMSDAFADFVGDGKADIKSLAKTILKEFMKLFFNQFVKWLVTGEGAFGTSAPMGQRMLGTVKGMDMSVGTPSGSQGESLVSKGMRGTVGFPIANNGETKVGNYVNNRINTAFDAVANTGLKNIKEASSGFKETSNYLMSNLKKDFGLTDYQAAGVVGNLAHETGGFKHLQEINPTVKGSRGGFGFPQWTGPRRRQFEAYTAKNGMDMYSKEANYAFMKHELNTSEKGALKALRGTSNAHEATRIFEQRYERAGIKHYASRDKYTQQALNNYDPVASSVFPASANTNLPGALQARANAFAPTQLPQAGTVLNTGSIGTSVQEQVKTAFSTAMPDVANNFKTQMQQPTQDIATNLRTSLDPMKQSGQDFTMSLKPANDQVASDYTAKMQRANSQVASSVGAQATQASGGLQTLTNNINSVGSQASQASGGLGGFAGSLMGFIQQILGMAGGMGGGSGGFGGILSGVMGLFGGFSEGGLSTSPVGPKYSAPMSAFAGAPHYAEGTANTSGGIPAVLHDNEAVIPLSRGRKVPVEMKGAGNQGREGFSRGHQSTGYTTVFNIQTPDADSFKRSQSQISARQAASAQRASSRNN